MSAVKVSDTHQVRIRAVFRRSRPAYQRVTALYRPTAAPVLCKNIRQNESPISSRLSYVRVDLTAQINVPPVDKLLDYLS